MKPARILIADDHEIVRQALRTILMRDPAAWEICDYAANGAEAVAKTRALSPDIVILDLVMPVMNGIEALRQIKQMHPATEVLIFSGTVITARMAEAIKAGARGFLLKGETIDHLIPALQALRDHRVYHSPEAADLFRQSLQADDEPSVETLTPRERETLRLLASGKTSKEIASALGISLKTVETHRTHVLQKLHLHSATEATRYAIRHHLIEP